MTKLEKITFILENTSGDGAAKLINSVDQMTEVQTIEDGLYENSVIYTTQAGDTAMKAAMIVAVNNGII